MNRLVAVVGAMVVAGGSLRAIPHLSATPQAPTSQKPAQKPASQKAAPAGKPVAPAELDRLLAPVALYPDSLLAQILQCAQKPSKVGALAEWMAGQQALKGSALQDAAVKSGFEPSFVALVVFPDVVNAMASQIDRTTKVGQAFTADRSAVFASVQRLRAKAKNVGTLKTTPQQEVSTQPTSAGEVIVIEPANPDVVYVPQYNPEVVYTQPASTTVVIQEEDDDDYAEAVAAGMIGFTAGVAIGAAVNNNYYYGGYGYRGGLMYDDAWDDYYDHREDARDDWQDHREDIYEDRGDVARETQEQRTERAQNAQEQRTERTQTRQENPQTQAQREQRRTDAQAKAGEARSTGATSQEARGFSGDGGQTRERSGDRSGTKSDAFSGYSSGKSERAASSRGERSRSSSGGSRGGGGGSRGGGGGGRRR